MTIPIGLVAIVAIIVIAELGRLLVAKLFGYTPERHAIPIMKLPGSRGTTGFRLSLILAGPVAAYLAIGTLAFFHFRSAGVHDPESARVVDNTSKTYDADGKLRPGDVILEVDGSTFSGGARELSSQVNARKGAAVALTVERDGARQTVTIQPRQDAEGRWLLGVMLDPKVKRSSAALKHAVLYPVDTTGAIVTELVHMVKGDDEPDAGGPVRLAEEFKAAFEPSPSQTITGLGILFGVYVLLALALFDLVRAFLLILFRS